MCGRYAWQKQTTSTMIAHILKHSDFGCNAFLGGIAVNYDTNFWSSENNVCVVEADEYDRSFLKLSPRCLPSSPQWMQIIWIYTEQKNRCSEAFIDFSAKIKAGGLLISKLGLARSKGS
ncbi:MAG: hypothetical protein WDM71_04040 [Ferruginibacter sp.]